MGCVWCVRGMYTLVPTCPSVSVHHACMMCYSAILAAALWGGAAINSEATSCLERLYCVYLTKDDWTCSVGSVVVGHAMNTSHSIVVGLACHETLMIYEYVGRDMVVCAEGYIRTWVCVLRG